MLHTYGPPELIADRIHDLHRHLPGVFDGAELAIHDARVAVRRACEALSVVGDDYDEDAIAAIKARLTKAASGLGRVRDADSGQQLIRDVEQRFPFAAATLAQLRVRLADKQYTSRRKVIKKLEALDLSAMSSQLARARRATGRWAARSRAWKPAITRYIAFRADGLRSSIEHATGVYFPNRAHSTRMAIKQLRYTLELAATLGASHPRRAVRLLKRAQEVLGAAHDREVLLAHLEALRRTNGANINDAEADALARFLRAETLSLHRRYADWRPELFAICDACTPAPRRVKVATAAAVVAGLGLPSLLLLKAGATHASPLPWGTSRSVRRT